MKKNVTLATSSLDKNLKRINDFLTEKGMSKIQGGKNEAHQNAQEPEWGNTNYSESTRPNRK